MPTTRAALFVEPSKPLDVREIELEPPGPGDVLVRMEAVGVCGSDLHVVRGEWKRPTPMVLGHEGAGVIEAVGEGVRDLAAGDRVIVHWAPSCGECAACRRGRPATCARLRAAIGAGTLLDGTTRMTYGGEQVYRMTSIGAFAERIVVAANTVIPLPERFRMDEAALLGCAALTGIGAVRNVARARPGDRALVVGAGGVGQFAVQALRIAGAEVIAVSDPSEARRDQACALGATHSVTPDELTGLVEQLGDGFDIAIEAVGAAPTVRAAMEATRIGGMTVLVGMAPTGTEVGFDAFTFTAQEKILVGSMYGSADPAVTAVGALSDAESGALELASILGPSYELDDINEAIEAALAGDAGRTTILPNGPSGPRPSHRRPRRRAPPRPPG
jgi:S-(hydroxymethyl)glutathione dehydrogenase / alcohol dehydrogenase